MKKNKNTQKRYNLNQIYTNLTPMQEHIIKVLTEHCRYNVLRADKNFGLAIANTDPLIRQAVDEHLRDTGVYK